MAKRESAKVGSTTPMQSSTLSTKSTSASTAQVVIATLYLSSSAAVATSTGLSDGVNCNIPGGGGDQSCASKDCNSSMICGKQPIGEKCLYDSKYCPDKASCVSDFCRYTNVALGASCTLDAVRQSGYCMSSKCINAVPLYGTCQADSDC